MKRDGKAFVNSMNASHAPLDHA